ncbi:hypothetical protein D3C84_1044830 [compost metagenome]
MIRSLLPKWWYRLPMLAPERSRIISMVVASTPCSLKQARAAWRMSSLREGRPMNVL